MSEVKFFKLSLKRTWPEILKLTLILIIGLLTIAVIYLPPYFRYLRLKKENQKMVNKIAQLKIQIKKLEKNLKDLKEGEPYLLEKLVRENLGRVKDNEIVVDIND